MRDLLWALISGGMFAAAALLITGAVAGEYHDIDSAVAWVSTFTELA